MLQLILAQPSEVCLGISNPPINGLGFFSCSGAAMISNAVFYSLTIIRLQCA